MRLESVNRQTRNRKQNRLGGLLAPFGNQAFLGVCKLGLAVVLAMTAPPGNGGLGGWRRLRAKIPIQHAGSISAGGGPFLRLPQKWGFFRAVQPYLYCLRYLQRTSFAQRTYRSDAAPSSVKCLLRREWAKAGSLGNKLTSVRFSRSRM